MFWREQWAKSFAVTYIFVSSPLSVTSQLLFDVSQKERRALDTKRLDLDAAKSRLRRAKTQQTRETVSHD